MKSWHDYNTPYTNNRAEQASLTIWTPRHNAERAEKGNWDHDFSIHV